MSVYIQPIIRPANCIATREESQWIAVSATLFIAPAVYGIFLKQYYHSAVLAATLAASLHYWQKATVSWRQKAEWLLTKAALAVFFSSNALCVSTSILTKLNYGLFGAVIYNYYMAHKTHRIHNPHWVDYYVRFHMLFSVFALLVIDSQ